MNKTINKSNWSGEKVDIRINIAKKTVSLYGVCGSENWETFKIVYTHIDSEMTTFVVTHSDWENALCGGYYDSKYKKYRINSYANNLFSLIRENECIYTAVAQVLYNIL